MISNKFIATVKIDLLIKPSLKLLFLLKLAIKKC